ncbi:RNA 2'-phosphotransferase [Moorena producens JHB]|uniref:Probable RNA 2'-phosphotransferase n=1 Tax=Moorena producens (strain JHB) TaxID=1454205 RepID=A0A1D9G897_MOOP1|nr:RNA 2'-phosphotransferase [Moorena producens]AOY83867.1 RNA 2'-phosphotransferase [Moorena producens JHB]
MNPSRLVKISKYLSQHLRHQPQRIGITLAPGGWVGVEELLAASKKHSFRISRADLNEVVAKNDKKRFSFDSTGTRIRANQGHTVKVDLQLEVVVPPDVLYHGTGHRAVESILRQGLCKMSRHHVHLSTDMAIAKKVGARHGRPVVFAIDAAAMHKAGYSFYCSDNGIWLVDSVSPEYLQFTGKSTCNRQGDKKHKSCR